jgi:hypothetical protein
VTAEQYQRELGPGTLSALSEVSGVPADSITTQLPGPAAGGRKLLQGASLNVAYELATTDFAATTAKMNQALSNNGDGFFNVSGGCVCCVACVCVCVCVVVRGGGLVQQQRHMPAGVCFASWAPASSQEQATPDLPHTRACTNAAHRLLLLLLLLLLSPAITCRPWRRMV